MIENSRKLKFMSIMTQEISDEWIPVWIDRLDKMGFFTAPVRKNVLCRWKKSLALKPQVGFVC